MKPNVYFLTATLAIAVPMIAQSSASGGSTTSGASSSSTGGADNGANNRTPAPGSTRVGNSIMTPSTNANAGQNLGASNATTSGAWVDRPAPGTPQTSANGSSQATTVNEQGTVEIRVTTPGLEANGAAANGSSATAPNGTSFNALDRDADGLVSLAEYTLSSNLARRQAQNRTAASAAATAPAGSATNSTQTTVPPAADSAGVAAQFLQLDVNNDGLLTRDELNGTARPVRLP